MEADVLRQEAHDFRIENERLQSCWQIAPGTFFKITMRFTKSCNYIANIFFGFFRLVKQLEDKDELRRRHHQAEMNHAVLSSNGIPNSDLDFFQMLLQICRV